MASGKEEEVVSIISNKQVVLRDHHVTGYLKESDMCISISTITLKVPNGKVIEIMDTYQIKINNYSGIYGDLVCFTGSDSDHYINESHSIPQSKVLLRLVEI